MMHSNQDAQQKNHRHRPRRHIGGARNKNKDMKQKQQQDTTHRHRRHSQRQHRQHRHKLFPWRRYIPKGSVDPITLEPLVALKYPPFALSNEAPYETIEVWPIPLSHLAPTNSRQISVHEAKHIAESNQHRIEEQWSGYDGVTVSSDEDNVKLPTTSQQRQQHQHVHLFDGKALATYMITQSQFIDPYNRRDLTRDELLNLDKYLKRNRLTVTTVGSSTSVTDAYDSKGITLSSAGAQATTVAGQTTIRRETAQNIFDALFATESNSTGNRYNNHRRRGRTPAEQQHSDEDRATANHFSGDNVATTRTVPSTNNDDYYASEDGGLMIIDDDENPGLRNGTTTLSEPEEQPDDEDSAVATVTTRTPTTPFYSASHIVQRYGNGVVGPDTRNFPTLEKKKGTVTGPAVKRQMLRSKLLGPRPRSVQSKSVRTNAWQTRQ